MKIIINKARRKAFTLIEMIGVLAVIAILAALLIPKIFEAINNARINNACISVNTVKTALADHYAKYGSLASANGAVIAIGNTSTNFDSIALLAEGFIDKPFEVKISNASDIRLVQGATTATAASGANSAYDLDGSGTANDAGPDTAVVAEALITNVNATDAWELSKRLDGEQITLTPADASTEDLKGRVKYATPANGVTDVHVYLTHR
jgi:prepilin-type N-terminal cleavage/methylation domain-containing protein